MAIQKKNLLATARWDTWQNGSVSWDTVFWNNLDDSGLLEKCILENRVLLTRNTAMIKRIGKENMSGKLTFLFIQSNDVMDQLRNVIVAFGLTRECHLNRCAECNTVLADIHKQDAEGQVPDYVYETHDRFKRCPSCGKYYWEGSHVRRMETRISSLFA